MIIKRNIRVYGNRRCYFWRQKCDQERNRECSKQNHRMIKIQCISNVKTSDTKSNHLKITQKIPEQHTGKAHHQGATDNSHTGH